KNSWCEAGLILRYSRGLLDEVEGVDLAAAAGVGGAHGSRGQDAVFAGPGVLEGELVDVRGDAGGGELDGVLRGAGAGVEDAPGRGAELARLAAGLEVQQEVLFGL